MFGLGAHESTLTSEQRRWSRDRRAARLRLVVLLILVVNLYFASQQDSMLVHANVIGGYAAVTVIALTLAELRRGPNWPSTLFVILDALIVVILFHAHLFTRGNSLDHDLTAASLAIGFVLLTHVALRLRPFLLVMFAGIAVTGWLSLLAVAVDAHIANGPTEAWTNALAEGSLAAAFSFAAFVCWLLTRDHNALLQNAVAAERRRATLSRFFSPAVLSELEADDASLALTRRDVAIMFVDLRSFTRYSESAAPEATAELLAEFRDLVTREVFAHGGMIDKYIGDGVMAAFGQPKPMADFAERAVLCALHLSESLASWRESREHAGKAAPDAGIGLHIGTVIGGVLHSGSHDEFTLLGDAVNVADRLEKLCKPLEASIVTSAETLKEGQAEAAAPWLWCEDAALQGRAGRLRIAYLPRIGTPKTHAERDQCAAQSLDHRLTGLAAGGADGSQTRRSKMTDKLRLELPILLPDLPHAADACVARLVGEIQAREGVEHAHITPANDSTPAQLCVHYGPAIVSLPRIRELLTGAGARITGRYGHLSWQVEGITHQRRARSVSERLQKVPGVLEASADAAGQLRVEFDRQATSEQAIRAVLKDLRVSPSNAEPDEDDHAGHDHGPGGHSHGKHAHGEHGHGDHGHGDHAHNGEGHSHSHGGFLGPNTELYFALACGALVGVGYAVQSLARINAWIPMGFYIAAYFFGGFFTLREAIDNIRLKKFEIDTLMLVAAVGAAFLGAWAEGALLLFLFSLGHALEHYAMGRAKQAVEALAKLAPRTATVRRDGETREVPVEELAVGDIVIVRPNERLPADGFLVKGTTSIDQAPVTGESIPVDKRPVSDQEAARARPDSVQAASRIFAGTINGTGAIEVEVTRGSGDSTLARVVKMVSEAETQKSPTQRFTDRFERVFVPAVLALSVALLFAWVVIDEPFRDSFYRAMAVLVAASPCALAIATPSAVLSGVARAARAGVLVKGGAPLETLGSLRAIAFDKTGTLTEGRPRITDVMPADGVSEEQLLSVAVAVESLSDHPLAAAIARDGKERLSRSPPATATDLRSLTGRGVTAQLDGKTVWIGKAEMFGTDGVPPLSDAMAKTIAVLRDTGRTTMAVRQGDRDLGAIGLMDKPRPTAGKALERLRALGIRRMIMISGDHVKVAGAIAKEVGLDEAWGDLMPEDKVEAIRKLRAEAEVAMVGDGVNDAPAMANATVGIAMGAAGSDVALETADVALMADDLSHLPFAVGLSRHTRSVIRQNVFISLGVVALLVPATVFGLGIGPAVAAHEGSTLLVVFNALRLLAYRDRGS